MTSAVCLECGKMKGGAWTACPSCGYQPRGAEELAKSLMISGHDPDKLAEFAKRRQQGEPFIFNPEMVKLFEARIAALIPLTPDGLPAAGEGDLHSAELPSKEIPPPSRRWWKFWI